MRKLLRQFGRFAIVGSIAFLIDFVILLTFTEVFKVDYLLSATIGFTTSIVFCYFASMKYVFRHKDGLSRRREFVVFVVLSAIGLLLNDGLMYLGVTYAGVDYRLMKLLATMAVTLYNFNTRRKFLDAGAAEEDAFI